MNYLLEYRIVRSCIERVYAISRSDSVGGLLGDMAILSDGNPADPAIARDWEDAVSAVLWECPNKAEIIARRASVVFLDKWLAVGEDADIARVRDELSSAGSESLWRQAVDEVIKGCDQPNLSLIK